MPYSTLCTAQRTVSVVYPSCRSSIDIAESEDGCATPLQRPTLRNTSGTPTLGSPRLTHALRSDRAPRGHEPWPISQPGGGKLPRGPPGAADGHAHRSVHRGARAASHTARFLAQRAYMYCICCPASRAAQLLSGHPRTVWSLDFHLTQDSYPLLATACLGGRIRCALCLHGSLPTLLPSPHVARSAPQHMDRAPLSAPRALSRAGPGPAQPSVHAEPVLGGDRERDQLRHRVAPDPAPPRLPQGHGRLVRLGLPRRHRLLHRHHHLPRGQGPRLQPRRPQPARGQPTTRRCACSQPSRRAALIRSPLRRRRSPTRASAICAPSSWPSRASSRAIAAPTAPPCTASPSSPPPRTPPSS